jgi:hypothetical protein
MQIAAIHEQVSSTQSGQIRFGSDAARFHTGNPGGGRTERVAKNEDIHSDLDG